MKSMSFILMIIILAMQFMPCTDNNLSNKGIAKLELIKKDTGQHQNKPDACSPFCTCSCCAMHVITRSSLKITLHPPLYSPEYSECPTGGFMDVSLPIWKPPQLIS